MKTNDFMINNISKIYKNAHIYTHIYINTRTHPPLLSSYRYSTVILCVCDSESQGGTHPINCVYLRGNSITVLDTPKILFMVSSLKYRKDKASVQPVY